MKVVIDIEANGLTNPTKIWCIICKDIDTGIYYDFINPSDDWKERNRFEVFSKGVKLWIGHNLLGYDWPVLDKLLGSFVPSDDCIDTLVISKMADFSRNGHSVEDFGIEFGLEKGKFSDFSKYSSEMLIYCRRDVDITEKIYHKYIKFIKNKDYLKSITLEHKFTLITNTLNSNGFFFNKDKGIKLLEVVNKELGVLDKGILEAFTPKTKLIKEVNPKVTKYGTISLTSIPKALRQQIPFMSIDAPFSYFKYEDFNPSSHKQIINVLNEAGWSPIDKTQTHIETEREINQLRYRPRTVEIDQRLKELYAKQQLLTKTGWKVNEVNLETLPASAPPSAKMMAKRIMLESRRRTLTEWLGLVTEENSRIHGKFYGIGAWTQRMAHQSPNTANIPNEFDTQGKKKLYGKELRALWGAPKNRLLVGVDAEGIQLRIFAHYIDDPEFTEALVNGRKDNKTDPHSLNQSILGSVCKSRAAAKRYIYALLLGAGQGKLRQILDCDEQAAMAAYDRLLSRYTGFAYLKDKVIPADAKRGWFYGLDGRPVRIPGESVGSRRHLAMSGYLQNGEAVVMKSATLKWHDRLASFDAKLVNFVHDEWQTECPNNVAIALEIAELQANSLKIVGEELGLKCPLAGSYWNDDLNDYTIATNWSKTH